MSRDGIVGYKLTNGDEIIELIVRKPDATYWHTGLAGIESVIQAEVEARLKKEAQS